MTSTTMTLRQYHTAILNSDLPEDIRAKAQEELAKLDKKNSGRSSKPTKEQIANEPIVAAILNALGNAPDGLLSTELAAALDVSTQKITGLCRNLMNDGKITSEKVTVPKKGKQTKYHIVTEENPTDDDTAEEISE